MSVKKDASGRRSVQVEVEVPGKPEEVWQAIATGAGISSWFVPTEFVQGDDGKPAKLVLNFGPGMESEATVTKWEPPRRFAAESNWASDSPLVATEWTVEARSGGTCIVRVVHSLFSDSDDWDDQLKGTESGWPGFFRVLRLYLTHFNGQRSASAQMMCFAPEPASTAWQALTSSLGLDAAVAGERSKASAGPPPLAGLVERIGENETPELLLRLDEPTAGIAQLNAVSMGGQVCLGMRLYLYGDDAERTAQRDQPLWQAWLNEQFPAVADS